MLIGELPEKPTQVADEDRISAAALQVILAAIELFSVEPSDCYSSLSLSFSPYTAYSSLR